MYFKQDMLFIDIQYKYMNYVFRLNGMRDNAAAGHRPMAFFLCWITVSVLRECACVPFDNTL